MNIVIIDDDREYVEKICKELESRFEVVGLAHDGKTGLELIKRVRPDVVLLDIVMPEYDGYWLLDELKNSKNLAADTRVVVVSALTKEGFVVKAYKSGASGYIFKPCKVEELISKILDDQGVEEERVRVRMRQKSMEESISNIFMTVGIPAHIKGYAYLREAIKLSVDNPSIVNAITKGLYPAIAIKHNTTSSKVERAIRHAIEVAWNRGKIENINSYFGVRVYTNKDRPTNVEFIALIADKMAMDMA